MSTYDRDETTRQALQQSSAWQRIVGKTSLLILAKVGPLELDSLSDQEHAEIRAWALSGSNADSAPAAILSYFHRLEQ
jgi:hypothetical protein